LIECEASFDFIFMMIVWMTTMELNVVAPSIFKMVVSSFYD